MTNLTKMNEMAKCEENITGAALNVAAPVVSSLTPTGHCFTNPCLLSLYTCDHWSLDLSPLLK
jgi:hypothetical protein